MDTLKSSILDNPNRAFGCAGGGIVGPTNTDSQSPIL